MKKATRKRAREEVMKKKTTKKALKVRTNVKAGANIAPSDERDNPPTNMGWGKWGGLVR